MVEHLSKRFKVPLDRTADLLYRLAHPVRTSRYREFLALDNVSFSIEAGEFLGITGPNGCGKSTLLKILSRIYEPDAGRISINGRVSPFLELGVGFKDELTARENIFLAGALHGLTREQLQTRVGDVLDFAELAPFADQKLKNFSSGMVVRLAFSVAMLADADILLMDEVLAVGDAHFQEKCFDVFAHYKRSGRTVVLVTHDLAALESHCDRVILLDGGTVVRDGLPSEVVAVYRQRIAAMSEAQQVEAISAEHLIAAANRWGSGEVEITRVRTLGPDDDERHLFTCGEPLRIAIDYEIRRQVSGFSCQLSIRHYDGVILAAPDTRVSRTELLAGAPGTRGTVFYDVPALFLLGGHYLLSVAMRDSHGATDYDHLEDVLPLAVQDDRGRRGIVELQGSWTQDVGAKDTLRVAAG